MKTSLLPHACLASLLLFTTVSYAADKEKDKTTTESASNVPADYPLKKCVVSDEPLGEMGKPVKATHNGTDVYLCCKSCLKDFNKDPDKYTQAVKDAQGKKS